MNLSRSLFSSLYVNILSFLRRVSVFTDITCFSFDEVSLKSDKIGRNYFLMRARVILII